MLGKVTRIFLKSIGVILLAVVLFGTTMYFAIQSYSFQTWLGKKTSVYLSSELKTEVDIQKIQIDFFKKATLTGLLLKDLKGDTLYNGNLQIEVETFNWKKKKLHLNTLGLDNVVSKLIKYKKTKDFNFQFLVDYFGSDSSKSNNQSSWDFKLRNIELKKLTFIYIDQNDTTKLLNNINFNDIHLSNVNGRLTNIYFKKDSLYSQIINFNAVEKSGFYISKLSTKASITSSKLHCNDLYLKTTATLIKGKVHFNFKKWDDYSDFINKVHFNSNFEDSTSVSFKDISYFAPVLNNFNEQVSLSGNIKGTVSDFSLKKFNLKYRENTQFRGNLSLSGLPDLTNSFLHFDAKTLSTNFTDLIKIPSYPFSENKKITIPIEIQKLGNIYYTGKFDGLIKDFTTYGEFKTALGNVNSELSIQLGEKIDDIGYQGNLSTVKFNLGQLIGINDFNGLSMNFNIKGKGLSLKNINSEANGIVHSVVFHNYNYQKIKLNGTLNEKVFNGLFSCLDTNANFDFNGSINFKNKVPEMYFISSINRLNLNKLKLISIADSGEFSSQLFINIKGDNIDNLSGQVNLDNSIYKTKIKNYKLNTLNIDLNQTSNLKEVILKSGYFNAKLEGKYKIGNIVPAFENLLYYYYPSYFQIPKNNKLYDDDFNFEVEIKNFETIHDLFLPNLMLSKNSRLNGHFNAVDQKLSLIVKTNWLTYNLFKFNEFSLSVDEEDKTVVGNIKSKSIYAGDSVNIQNFVTSIKSVNVSSNYQINWDNLKKQSSKAILKGRIFYDSKIMTLYNDSINICVNDSSWILQKPNFMTFMNDQIQINTLSIFHNQEKISVNGIFSDNLNDSLDIDANKLNLAQFNPLLKLIKLKTEGELNGSIVISHPNKNFAFNGNMNLNGLKINENLVGELSVHSHYNTNDNFVNLQGFTSLGLQNEFGQQIKNISFNGKYFLDNRPESVDIDLNANPANIKLINPLLDGILFIKNGYVNGDIKIHGSPENLKLHGKLRLFNCDLKVNYTNVDYNVSGDIDVLSDQIRFSELLIREKGTKAAAQGTLNGNIFHDKFKKIRLDYDINYKNMLVLNTTEKENKTFYGKIYSTGRAGIYGYLNNLNMEIFDTLTKNSKFIMPLDGPNEIADDDFVRFLKRDTVKIEKEFDFSGFNLDLYLHATPSTSVQIILDKQNGDMLNAQGQGNLNLNINTLGKFEMIGDYIITNGDYLFTLEHVINKKFDIEAGSRISWNGNPMNAEINVATSYKQRASVAPLLNDTTGQYKSRFAIDCKLLLTGKLFSPNITFAFAFPNIDANANARINNVLSDEAELNRQVFSFLLFRNFVTPQIFNTNGGGVTAGSAAASTSSELLSNRISGFLNSYFGGLTGLKNLNLGVNYRPANQNSKETVDLALSKQFFNNKISVDGNFGVNNNQTNNSSGFIGDVNIDYKLTDDGRYRLTGFNRTNNITQMATVGGAYTQGVGFFYRREFNSFKDFLNRNK